MTKDKWNEESRIDIFMTQQRSHAWHVWRTKTPKPPCSGKTSSLISPQISFSWLVRPFSLVSLFTSLGIFCILIIFPNFTHNTKEERTMVYEINVKYFFFHYRDDKKKEQGSNQKYWNEKKKETNKSGRGSSVSENQINSSFTSIRPINCILWFQNNLHLNQKTPTHEYMPFFKKKKKHMNTW